MKFPGTMTKRGFWLYVWRVMTPAGELLYVGRTGDNSSPYAAAPFARAGQHLGKQMNQNALRKHLLNKDIQPEDCETFELVAHGPVYAECDSMSQHIPIRNHIGAIEKALAEQLANAGYEVLNEVSCKYSCTAIEKKICRSVFVAFQKQFPRLKMCCCASDSKNEYTRESNDTV